MSNSLHATSAAVVDESTRKIAAAFEIGLTRIGEIRSGTAELAKSVEALLAVAGSGTSPDSSALTDFVAVADASAREAEGVAAALVGGSKTGVLNDVGASLRQMSKCATELMATSMLAKITGAAPDQALDNAVFVERLDDRARDLKDTAEMALARVQRIDGQIGTARTLLSEMSQASQAVLTVFRNDRRRLAELEAAHRTHVATTRDNNAKLVEDTAAAVRRLIGCLQYPDTFAQRIAHVSRMLAALEDAPSPSEGWAIRRLGQAQLDSISGALDAVCSEAGQALAAIRTALDGASCGHWDRSPSTGWILALEQGSDTISTSAADTRARLDSALSVLATTSRNVQDAAQALNASQSLNAQMTNAAHNAAIAASRSDNSASALRFLAGSVKGTVQTISDLAGDLTEALGLLSDLSSTLESSSLAASVAELERVRGTADATARSAAVAFRDFEALQSAIREQSRRIGAATEIATEAFAEAGGQSTVLRDIAARIAPEAPRDRDSLPPADTRWIFDLYTMEEERAVHRDLFPADEEPAAEVTEDSDELDDFLM